MKTSNHVLRASDCHNCTQPSICAYNQQADHIIQIAGTVQLGVQAWMFTHIHNLCDPHQVNGFIVSDCFREI